MAPSSEREALRRLLVACALTDGSPVDPALVRAAGRSVVRLPDAARYHGIGAGAWLALRETGLSTDVARSLEHQHERALLWHLLIVGQLGRLGAALDAAGIPWLTFKGPVASDTLYPRPDIRQYVDLDVLVAPEHFAAALDTTLSLRGQVVEHDWPSVLHDLKGELNIALRSGGVVDLHWTLLYDEHLRRQFTWRDAELLERRRSVPLSDGSRVPTFDPNDALLHLLVHACLAGGQRLGWMRDILLASSAPGVDAAVVLERARAYGVDLCAGVMLRRVRKTLGVPALPAVLDDALTAGERWPDLIAALDRVRPPSAWHGGHLSGHIVIGSTRRSSAASRLQLTRRARQELDVLRSDPNHPWRRLLGRPPVAALATAPAPSQQVHDEPSPFRTAYLRAVGAQAPVVDSLR